MPRIDELISTSSVGLMINDLNMLGGCPRIDILIKIEAFTKNQRSHISDIASIIFCE